MSDVSARPRPTMLRSLWASISAVTVKESRWRMRGRRAYVIVTVYVALLALLVFSCQGSPDQSLPRGFDGEPSAPPGIVSITAASLVGQTIFTLVLVVQMLLTLLLAPALSSGAISMEREKQTLELLITTPVSTLGLVIGKLVSSLGYVFLLTLASIPLMSLVFAFGGIAPEDVVRAYLLLFAVAIGTGAIGLFMSALIKRTQIATALSYVIVFMLTLGAWIIHTWLLVASISFVGDRIEQRSPPEAILLLNPFVAIVDLSCTAIPDSYFATCGYIATIGNHDLENPADLPRDAFWPRSGAAFILLGGGLTLLATQLIAPSRRLRRLRRLRPRRDGLAAAEPPPATG